MESSGKRVAREGYEGKKSKLERIRGVVFVLWETERRRHSAKGRMVVRNNSESVQRAFESSSGRMKESRWKPGKSGREIPNAAATVR